MQTVVEESWLALTDAALALRRPYRATLDLLLTGKLAGKRVEGRWVVDRDSLAQFRAQRGDGSTHRHE